MQHACYEVAVWLRWPAGLLACLELPRYVEEVAACSHVEAAQQVMQRYGLKRVAQVAVAYHGAVERWSFLPCVEDREES